MKISTVVVLGIAGFYFYNKLNTSYQAALADRNALLAMLTPEQQAALMSAIQASTSVVTQAAQTVAAAVQTPAPSTSVPLSGLGDVMEFQY